MNKSQEYLLKNNLNDACLGAIGGELVYVSDILQDISDSTLELDLYRNLGSIEELENCLTKLENITTAMRG